MYLCMYELQAQTLIFFTLRRWQHTTENTLFSNVITPSVFNEGQFGTKMFVELYNSMLSSPVSSYMLKRYITFYFIDFTIVVYCYYGYLPIL